MDEPAQHLVHPDGGAVGRPGSRIRPRLRRLELKASVGPGPVVMNGVRSEHSLEVAAAEYQDPVQALRPGGADPPLGVSVRPQQRADRRDPDAELGELTANPDAAPPGVLLPICRMRSRTWSVIDGLPPVDLRRKVHFLRTSSRCQRSSVWGLTTNVDHRARGRILLNAAKNSRSRGGEVAGGPPG